MTIDDKIRDENLQYDNKREAAKLSALSALSYETNKDVYNFKQFKTIRPFAKNIFARQVTLNKGDKDHSNLLREIGDFNKKTEPRHLSKKSKKEILVKA